MASRRLGVVQGTTTWFGLADAAREQPGIEAVDFSPPHDAGELDAVVVDAAIEERETLLTSVGAAVDVPILVEMPVATSPEGVDRLEDAPAGSRIVSINPLAHQFHTRRLLEIIRDEEDPVTAVFAAWRFRPGEIHSDAVPQLLDFVARISTEPPIRIAAMRRESPDVLLATIRFEDGIVAQVECGTHLPESFAAPSELTVEVFRRESVLHADPFRQALTVQNGGISSADWSSPAATAALEAVLDTVVSEGGPWRGLPEDHAALTVVEAIEWAAERGSVARL